jgi:hypothetical protein
MPNIPLPPNYSKSGDACVTAVSEAQESDQNYRDGDRETHNEIVPGFPPPAP